VSLLGTAGGIGSESRAFSHGLGGVVPGATLHLLAMVVLVVLLALWWWDHVRARP
jgi:hypothetical protein